MSIVKVHLLVKYSSQKRRNGKILLIFNAENGFESTNFEIFEEVVHNFGRSEDDMIC